MPELLEARALSANQYILDFFNGIVGIRSNGRGCGDTTRPRCDTARLKAGGTAAAKPGDPRREPPLQAWHPSPPQPHFLLFLIPTTARLARGEENIKTLIKLLRLTPPLGFDLACALPLIIIYIFAKNFRSVVGWEEKNQALA